MVILPASCLIEGEASGALTLWSVPLSFWGGLDPVDGRVIDRSHPAFGESVAGRILAMPFGRGSSSASSVLAEAIRRGTAPAGLILTRPDPILLVGALVARELYGLACPMVITPPDGFSRLAGGAHVAIAAHPAGSTISVSPAALSPGGLDPVHAFV